MNATEFDKLVDETIARTAELLKVKGGEYAGSEDRLANFKRGAELTGVSPLQVLHIYLSKHYDSFSTFVRDQASGTTRPRSEEISGRLDDIINYCLLAQGLIRELEQSAQSVRPIQKEVVDQQMTLVHTVKYGMLEMTRAEAEQYLMGTTGQVPAHILARNRITIVQQVDDDSERERLDRV